MLRTNIYLPESLVKRLKQHAKRQEATVSELARQYLDAGIKRDAQKDPVFGLLQLSQKAKKGSGLTTVSKQMDYYLYGGGRVK